MNPPVIGKPPSDNMKMVIIAAIKGAFLAQAGQVVNVVADDSATSQTDDHAERAHIHQRVDEEIDDESE